MFLFLQWLSLFRFPNHIYQQDFLFHTISPFWNGKLRTLRLCLESFPLDNWWENKYLDIVFFHTIYHFLIFSCGLTYHSQLFILFNYLFPFHRKTPEHNLLRLPNLFRSIAFPPIQIVTNSNRYYFVRLIVAFYFYYFS